eukprot:CAMPEP_0172515116 /NCGR_PEP_ID=MMETSP1066-20121228/265464_1 /TAXON_ID=671091 /ORGANISM="Coscinodiscus wailesii, Strain CCMP2513" /LENGTH=175 /DNA_ID=CAMNT_0013296067 /DNA_START=291 /DNA_END=818 /DNA_ORIENTATION=-
MDYATYVHDVEHIILDNMQFMLTRQNSKDKFDVQDVAIEKFRRFATERNVHVTLVVHPRKEDEGVKLSISSIYGSAKATQEADTVILLQNEAKRKYIEVKKNRFDGTTGICNLFFQKESGRYGETPEPGIDAGQYYNDKDNNGNGNDGAGVKNTEKGSSSGIMESVGHIPEPVKP